METEQAESEIEPPVAMETDPPLFVAVETGNVSIEGNAPDHIKTLPITRPPVPQEGGVAPEKVGVSPEKGGVSPELRYLQEAHGHLGSMGWCCHDNGCFLKAMVCSLRRELRVLTAHPARVREVRHTLTPSHYHTITPSHCHTITLSYCHTLTLSPLLPLYPHTVTPSHYHTITLSHCTPSHHHTITLSHCHIITLSHCHTITLPHYHPLTPSHPHTLTDVAAGFGAVLLLSLWTPTQEGQSESGGGRRRRRRRRRRGREEGGGGGRGGGGAR